MDDARRKRKLRRMILLASIPACLVALALNRSPVREFVSVHLVQRTVSPVKSVDVLPVSAPENALHNRADRRLPVAED